MRRRRPGYERPFPFDQLDFFVKVDKLRRSATDPESEVLAEAMNDRLHEPHRLKLMPETFAVHSELRKAGLAVALAGAGPSLLVVVPRPEAKTRAEQVRRVCRARNAGWRVFVSEWESSGATTIP